MLGYGNDVDPLRRDILASMRDQRLRDTRRENTALRQTRGRPVGASAFRVYEPGGFMAAPDLVGSGKYQVEDRLLSERAEFGAVLDKLRREMDYTRSQQTQEAIERAPDHFLVERVKELELRVEATDRQLALARQHRDLLAEQNVALASDRERLAWALETRPPPARVTVPEPLLPPRAVGVPGTSQLLRENEYLLRENDELLYNLEDFERGRDAEVEAARAAIEAEVRDGYAEQLYRAEELERHVEKLQDQLKRTKRDKKASRAEMEALAEELRVAEHALRGEVKKRVKIQERAASLVDQGANAVRQRYEGELQELYEQDHRLREELKRRAAEPPKRVPVPVPVHVPVPVREPPPPQPAHLYQYVPYPVPYVPGQGPVGGAAPPSPSPYPPGPAAGYGYGTGYDPNAKLTVGGFLASGPGYPTGTYGGGLYGR